MPAATASPRFSYKSDRLKPLRAFCQTVRLGSVSRAAEALFISQPAVTLQLQALEREFGVVLFERSGRRLVPSREGQVLYEMAQPLVENLDGLAERFRDKISGLDAGELRIAANSTTILYLLPKVVAAFRQLHPQVADRFSWFDYRSRGFEDQPKRGLRIDLILTSQALTPRLQAAGIDYELRGMDKPSDHAPVWLQLG